MPSLRKKKQPGKRATERDFDFDIPAAEGAEPEAEADAAELEEMAESAASAEPEPENSTPHSTKDTGEGLGGIFDRRDEQLEKHGSDSNDVTRGLEPQREEKARESDDEDATSSDSDEGDAISERRSSTSSIGELVWTRPTRDPNEPWYTRIVRLVEDPEPFDHWATRIRLPEETRQQLQDQERHAKRRSKSKSAPNLSAREFESSDFLDGKRHKEGGQSFSRALGCCTLNHIPRRAVIRALASRPFGLIAIGCILTSAACLGLMDPKDDPARDVMFSERWTVIPGKPGCVHRGASNYNPDAEYDDGTCDVEVDCRGSCARSKHFCRVYSSSYRLRCHVDWDAEKGGCMNPNAANYEEAATHNVAGACGNCSRSDIVDRDECEATGRGSWKSLIYLTDYGLLIFFSVEMAMKILAAGFIAEPHSYLRVGWNWLDIIVVIPAWLPDSWYEEDSTLRVVRLLRPLRTINRFAGLRRLTGTLLAAIPQLSGLASILLIYILLFSITGVQLWSGRWKQRCVPTEDNVTSLLDSSWSGNTSGAKSSAISYSLPTGQFCDLDLCTDEPEFADAPCRSAGCYKDDQCVKGTENPFQFEDLRPGRTSNVTDIMSFDSVPDALPIIFQVFTLASWQELMHITQDTSGKYSAIYFIVAVILGSYFLVQLFVAILKENFDIADSVVADGVAHFIHVDTDGSGELDRQEVMRVFLNAGLYLQENEFDLVFDDMDPDGNGVVELGEFIRWLRGGSETAVKLRNKMSVDDNLGSLLEGQDSSSTDILADASVEEMVLSAKHKLKLLSTSSGRVDFSVLFEYYNVDGDPSLSLREFRVALRRDAQIAPSHMSNAEIEELFNQIDENKSGSIELKEFEDWMAVEDLKLPPVDELLQSAMKQHIVKEACTMLSIKHDGATQGFRQVEDAMRKHEESRILKEFVLGTGFRRMHVNYQPKLQQYSVGGFRDGKHTGHSGPPVVTITQDVIEPFIGHSVCFQTEADFRREMTEFGTTRGSTTPAAVVSTLVVAAEVIALGAFRTNMRAIVTTAHFKWVSLLCILTNIIVLMFDHYGMDPILETNLAWISHGFTLVFLVELVLRRLGSTRHEFWNDRFNIFETFIVVAGLLELYEDAFEKQQFELELSLGPLEASNPYWFPKLCKALRVLRVLRLIGAIKSMRTVVEVLLSTLWDLCYVLVMLGVFLYTFTVLGMQLYGAKLVEPDGSPPVAHWDNFHMATFTTFQIMTMDNYEKILRDCIRLRGPWTAIYFVVWIFIGAFVLVNLLLVTILDAYAAAATRFAVLEEKRATQEKLLMQWDSNNVAGIEKQIPGSNSEESSQPDKSLHVAYKYTSERKKCRSITATPAFDNFFAMLVLMNMVIVSYDTPWLDPDSATAAICSAASVLFTIAFCVESFVKIFAGGLRVPIESTAPEAAYLGPQNPNRIWNLLDMFINVLSIMDIAAQVVSVRHGQGRFFHSCRAFRTLRLVGRVKGLKVLVKSIALSLVSLYGVIGVMLFVWLVFGLSCVTFLKGRLYRCTDSDPGVEGMLSCVGSYVSEFPDGTVGLTYRSWHNPLVHFDDIFSAMYTLFEMSSMDEWVVKTRDAMDHTVLFKQPKRESNPLWAYFFMMFVVVNNFFLVNLFIGVIYSKYLKTTLAGIETLTKYQKEWLDIMTAVDRVRPVKNHVAEFVESEAAFNVVTSDKFEAAMLFVVVLNIVALSLKYDGEPSTWTTAQEVLNFVCTLVFTAEMLLKLYAFGAKGYWNTMWNRFDCFVVVTSWVEFNWKILMLHYEWAQDTDPTPMRLLRIIRVVGRISRLLKASNLLPKSAILIDTFISAIGGMLYVTMLITLILFVFAVIAMNLFGKVAHQGCIDEHRNFHGVLMGMLTLFGVATGDDFSCMVHSVMVTETDKSFAIKGACSEIMGTCGDPVSARIFFIFFQPIIMFTTIELFVNVVLDRYGQLTSMRALKITGDDLHAFVKAWQRIDNQATGSIPVARVQKLIDVLNMTARGLAYEPLAGEEAISLHELRLPERANDRMSRFIVTSNADEARKDPTYTFVDPQKGYKSSNGSIYFHELLYGLCERKCGTPMPKGCAVVTQTRANLSKRMPTVAHIFNRTSSAVDPNADRTETTVWDNPVDSRSADPDTFDVEPSPTAGMRTKAKREKKEKKRKKATSGQSAATFDVEFSNTFDLEVSDESSSTFDTEPTSAKSRNGKKGKKGKNKNVGTADVKSPTGDTFDVESARGTQKETRQKGQKGKGGTE